MTTQTHNEMNTLTAKAEDYIKDSWNRKELTDTNKLYLKLAYMRGYNTAIQEVTHKNNIELEQLNKKLEFSNKSQDEL